MFLHLSVILFIGGVSATHCRHSSRAKFQAEKVCSCQTEHPQKIAIHKALSLVGALEWQLSTYPDWTGMLGGTEVLVSGPCFPPGSGILCKFDDVIVDGFMVS